ncbi:helix-turn-helix transcriptional regulator [Streptomyces sp. NPDC000987]|uniref:helix-turn-helix domain-containing protein n=1 Tax=Streptomyces sp. NPDC000987 TaxID=3154374 RepID=UPI003321F462
MSNQRPNEARVIPLRPSRPSRPSSPSRPPHSSNSSRSSHSAHSSRQPAPRPVDAPDAARKGERPQEPLWRDLVGDVLRRERLAQERTLKDVADAARISMPYLSEVERGRKEASSEVLAAAARALGLGLGDLLSLAQGELTRQRHSGPSASMTPYDGLCLAA